MTPNFAISLDFDTLGLLMRGAEGWTEVATLSLDDPDLRGALARLRRTADEAGATDGGSIPVIAILPRHLVRLVDGHVAPRSRPVAHEALRAEIRSLADGMTPYPVDALALDWTAGRGQDEVQIAIVARETLEEGRTFLRAHGFDPVAFAALRHPGRYDATAWFATDGAGDVPEALRAETSLDQRAAPAIEGAAMPSGSDRPDGTFDTGEQDEAPGPRALPPPERAPMAKLAPPVPPARAPLRAGRGPGLPVGAVFPVIPRRYFLGAAAAVALLAVAAVWALRPDPEATDGASPSAASQPAAEVNAAASGAGQPREGSAVTGPTVMPEQEPPAPVQPAAEPTGSGPQVAAGPAADAPLPAAGPSAAGPDATPPTPDSDPSPDTDTTAPAAPMVAQPTVTDEDGPADRAASTGATDMPDPSTPAATAESLPPPAPALEDVTNAATARTPSGALAVTMAETASDPVMATPVRPAEPPRLAADTVPGQVALPPPYGVVYSFDAQGRILPTPEGVLTPEGFMLVAGRPPLPPLPRPGTVDALAAAAAPTDGAPATAEAATPNDVPEQGIVPPRPAARPPALLRAPPPLPGSSPAPQRPASIAGAAAAAAAEAVPAPAAEDAAPDLSQSGAPDPVERLPGPPVPAPRPRPAAIAALASQPVETAVPEATASALAVAESFRPAQRPAGLADRAAARVRAQEAATDDAEAAESGEIVESDLPEVRPSAEAAGVVAKQATVARGIDLEELSLIGVFGTERARYALVRQENGRIARVKVGDRLDGGRVVAIGDTELRYQKSGQTLTLRLPRG